MLCEDAAKGENAPDKTEKGREFWKDFQLAILWRVLVQIENLAALIERIFAPEVCLHLCLFHFYTDFPQTHASVAYRLGQAVCKTVAVSAVKVRIFPDAF